jgi:hypothetical protein
VYINSARSCVKKCVNCNLVMGSVMKLCNVAISASDDAVKSVLTYVKFVIQRMRLLKYSLGVRTKLKPNFTSLSVGMCSRFLGWTNG